MRKVFASIALIACISFILPNDLCAQGAKLGRENVKWPVDSLGNKGRNVIKWNLTPLILWDSKNINLSYERILRSHRSISVNAGFFRFPKLISANFDSIEVNNESKRNGFSVSFDYRRYFAKRNLGWAPDGLYWGFWTSYHLSNYDNELSVMDNSGDFIEVAAAGSFGIYAIGANLGYQFLIGKHFVIDLVMIGPAIARYSFKLKFSSNSSLDPELKEDITAALIEKIPGLEKIIDSGEIETSGNLSTSTIGLRFMIQIGYLF